MLFQSLLSVSVTLRRDWKSYQSWNRQEPWYPDDRIYFNPQTRWVWGHKCGQSPHLDILTLTLLTY